MFLSAVVVAVAERLYAVHLCHHLRRRLPRRSRRRLRWEYPRRRCAPQSAVIVTSPSPLQHARKTALKPMPIGNGPWQEIEMNFVVALPESKGFSAILVVTCRFSKMVRYIPCCDTWNSQLLARAFIKEVWRHFGLPKAITSDRDPRMASQMWRDINKN